MSVHAINTTFYFASILEDVLIAIFFSKIFDMLKNVKIENDEIRFCDFYLLCHVKYGTKRYYRVYYQKKRERVNE